jgi:hypothetical protein
MTLPKEPVDIAPFSHAALTFPKAEPEAIVEAIVEPQVDLSKVKEKAEKITETLNQLVTGLEAELDSIEQRVLLLVAQRLEKAK